MDAEALAEVLRKHRIWLDGDSDGEKANLRGAHLRGADLEKANLRGANLGGSNLRRANLRRANLGGSNLWGANLRRANLGGSNLWGANLEGCVLNWQSHDIIAELLYREAGDDTGKRKIAGLILVSRDWCWDKFLSLEDPEREWALSVLREYVVGGDLAPEVLRTQGGE